MKKVLFVFAIAMLSFGAVNAQEAGGVHFAGGLRVALPIGDMSETTKFGIGAELQAEYMFSEMVSGTFTTGYTSFMGKDFEYMGITVKGESTSYVPLLAGIRVYPSQNFFIGAKAGYGILTGGGAFNYEPQIGYNGTKIQIAVGYNALSSDGGTSSHIGLSALYKFN